MIFTSKKERELSDEAKSKVADLEIHVTMTLVRKHQYHEPSCASIEVKKILTENSDTPLREIIGEVRSIVENSQQEFESNIINSRHLSDGLIATEKAKNA